MKNTTLREAHEEITDELIQRAQAGDQKACEELMNQISDAMTAFCRSKLSGFPLLCATDPEQQFQDVMQEIWIKFFRYLQNFRGNNDQGGSCKITTWAYRLVLTTLLDLNRKLLTRKDVNCPLTGDGFGDIVGEALVSESAGPDERYELLEYFSLEIERILDQSEREIVLQLIQGHEMRDIGSQTGLQYQQLRRRVLQIRDKLAHLRES